jgi:DNA-binding MarR family transcriptional regulator
MVIEVIGILQQLGFTEYEAKAYTALLQRSPLNGYELAKASGLPRANVYGVLDKLQERGAVVRLDTPSGARYAPISPTELAQHLSSHFQTTLDTARHALDNVNAPAKYEYIWNTHGYPVLLDQARALLAAAQEQALVAIWPDEALTLAEDLAAAEKRGVKITTLCLAACARECGSCRGHIYRYYVPPEERNRWLVLVPDGQEVLAAEIGPGEEALAVRTRQRLLVDLISWYIRHSVALAAVVNDLGGRLQGLLSAETRSILASVGPVAGNGGWLQHMRRLLRKGGASGKGQE